VTYSGRPTHADVAQTIRAARERAGLTQSALAVRVGVAPSAISAYERGAREPRADLYLRIMSEAGFEVRWMRRLDDVEQSRKLVQVLELAEALPFRPQPMARARY
jgi:transcriptional regulator with XRE-family HTH domain